MIPEVFETFEHQQIIKSFIDFKSQRGTYPSPSEIKLTFTQSEVFDEMKKIMDVDMSQYPNEDFILEIAEKHFKRELFWQKLLKGKEACDKDEIDSKGSLILDELREVLSFSFDTEIGLDLKESAERMYESFNSEDRVVSSGIKNFDAMTKGGFHEKSLSLFLAQTNMGKTLIKCGLAVNALLQNKNVLYVTLEMSENKISERILANLFDVELDNLPLMGKERFMKKFEQIKSRFNTNLIIKEYPTKSINTNRIRNLIKELEVKKGFKPDIVFVDYLGILMPNTKKDANSNTEMKTISEELRGLAVEVGVPFVSAVQTNRGGFGSAEIDLTDIADSIGTTATADIIIGITQTDELRAAGLYSFIILKNRYGLNKMKTTVGVDYPKMRIFDATDDDNEQRPIEKVNIVDDAAVMLNHKPKNNKKRTVSGDIE